MSNSGAELQSLAMRQFFAVADCGSLTAASKVLHVSCSAISRQIGLLEQSVGAPLFTREAKGMRLTEAGHILLRYARRLALDSRDTLQAIAAAQGEDQRPITIACTQGLAHEFLPGSIAQFLTKRPDIRFRIWVGSTEAVQQKVRTGEADLAVTFSVESSEESQAVRVLYSRPTAALAVMSRNHPLAKRKRLSLRDLADYPIALTDEKTSTYRLYRQASHMAGRWIEPQVYSNYAGALHAYARDSQAIFFASHISISERLDPLKLVAIPLTNPEMQSRTVQVQVMRGRALPDVLDDFVHFIVRRFRALESSEP